MRVKRVASKKARSEPPPPPEQPKLRKEDHKTRFALLSRKSFGTIRRIDWDVLKILGLDETILELISHGGWDKLFAIEEPTYKELTLEMLSTVEVSNFCSFTRQPSYISFRAFGKSHRITQDQLGVYLGFYTEAFTQRPEFKNLGKDFPYPVISASYWNTIATESRTKKASQLTDPAHRYIHALLTHDIGGRLDSTGVVSRTDLLMLYSILQRYSLHMGHLVAEVLAHQGKFVRLGAIYAGPYITRMIKGMGLLDRTQGMTVVGTVAPLGMQTLVGATYRLARRQSDPGSYPCM